MASPARDLVMRAPLPPVVAPASSPHPPCSAEQRERTPAQTCRVLSFDTPERFCEGWCSVEPHGLACAERPERFEISTPGSVTASPAPPPIWRRMEGEGESDMNPATSWRLPETPIDATAWRASLEACSSIDEGQWGVQAPDRYRNGHQSYSGTGMAPAQADFNKGGAQQLPPLPGFKNRQSLSHSEQEDEISRFLDDMIEIPCVAGARTSGTSALLPVRGAESVPSSPQPASASRCGGSMNPVLDSSLWRSIAERDAQVWAQGMAFIGSRPHDAFSSDKASKYDFHITSGTHSHGVIDLHTRPDVGADDKYLFTPVSRSTISRAKDGVVHSHVGHHQLSCFEKSPAGLKDVQTPSTTDVSCGFRLLETSSRSTLLGDTPGSPSPRPVSEGHWERQSRYTIRSDYTTPQKAPAQTWEDVPYEEVPGGVELQPCSNCKRHFRPDRLLKHEAACHSVSTTRSHRGVFDSKQQRLKEMEDHWWFHDTIGKSPQKIAHLQHPSSSGSRRPLADGHGAGHNNPQALHRTRSAPSRGKTCSARNVFPASSRRLLAEVPSMPRPKLADVPVKLSTPSTGKSVPRCGINTPSRPQNAGSRASPLSDHSQNRAAHLPVDQTGPDELLQLSSGTGAHNITVNDAERMSEIPLRHHGHGTHLHKENAPPDSTKIFPSLELNKRRPLDTSSESNRAAVAGIANSVSQLYTGCAEELSNDILRNSGMPMYGTPCKGMDCDGVEHGDVVFPGNAGRYDIDRCGAMDCQNSDDGESDYVQDAHRSSDVRCSEIAIHARIAEDSKELSKRVGHSDVPSTPPRGVARMRSSSEAPPQHRSPGLWGEDAPAVMPAVWSQRTPPSNEQHAHRAHNIVESPHAWGVSGIPRDSVNSVARSSGASEVLTPMMEEVAALGMQVDQLINRRHLLSDAEPVPTVSLQQDLQSFRFATGVVADACDAGVSQQLGEPPAHWWPPDPRVPSASFSMFSAPAIPQAARPQYDPSRYSTPKLGAGRLEVAASMASPAFDTTTDPHDRGCFSAESLGGSMSAPETRRLHLETAVDSLEQQSLWMQDRVRECAQQIEERRRCIGKWQEEEVVIGKAAAAG